MTRIPEYFGTEQPLARSNVPGLLLAGTLALSFSRALRKATRRNIFRGSVVVITGGSRGLGLEVARKFAKERARLVLLARNGSELGRAREELSKSGADVYSLVCDVADKSQITAAVRDIVDHYGRVDVLVNNAGTIQFGPYENMDERDYEEAMNVHAWAPLRFIQEVLPVMKRQGSGRIVNITSIGGLVAFPHLLPYSMSKFAMVGLSDGMRSELAKDGITVTTIAPGLMRTGSHLNAQMKGQHEREFAWFAAANAMPLFSMSSERAAKKIVEACRAGRARVILNWQSRLLYGTNALFPGVYSALMKLTSAFLPEAGRDTRANARLPGYRSRSRRTPRVLTFLSDRASSRNNEIEATRAA